jgi:hypothetical protein
MHSHPTTPREEDPELELLQSAPTFYPILRSSLSSGLFGASEDSFDVLNPKPLIEICVRIQVLLLFLSYQAASCSVSGDGCCLSNLLSTT